MFSKFGVRNNVIKLVKSNFSIYRFLLILILALYESGNTPGSHYATESSFTIYQILFKDSVILFFVPLIFSLLVLIITYIKDKRESRKLTEGYYRDIIKDITPVELSYIDDYDIESKKDIIGTLLELQLKRKVEFSNEKIAIIDKKEKNLTRHEKYILNKLITKVLPKKKNVFNNEFKREILGDLKDSKLLNTNSESLLSLENKYRKFKNIFLIVFAIVLTIFVFAELDYKIAIFIFFMNMIIVVGSLTGMFARLAFMNIRKKSRIIQKNGCFYSIIGGMILSIIAFTMALIPFILLTLASRPDIVVTILNYSFLFIGILSIIVEFYLIMNSNKLSEKGKKIKTQLLGLKMFLKDYSNMNKKDLNEINLWDEYIIYAVILNHNKKIKKKIEKMMKEYFYAK